MPYTNSFLFSVKNKQKQTQINLLSAKDQLSIYFAYIAIESFIYRRTNKDKSLSQVYSIEDMYISWASFMRKSTHSKVNLDSIIRYFTILFTFKSKTGQFKESESIKYFNSFNLFYINESSNINTIYSASRQEQYFYGKVINVLIKADFFDILNENNVILFNKVVKSPKSVTTKPGKLKFKGIGSKEKLVSSFFKDTIKRITNGVKEYKVKFKFKRLVRFAGKLKQTYSNNINIPYIYNFIKKLKKKRVSKKKVGNKLIALTIKSDKFFHKGVQTKPQSFKYRIAPTQFNESYAYSNTTEQVKKVISLLTHSHFSFYKLNALSITRFQFEIARNKELKKNQIMTKKRKSGEFLSQLEQKIEARYRYIAIYVKDLVRITFFCMYLKKADFIANFYAFILSKLPRKRKETKLINFFLRILKVFSAQRPEMIAVRLRFQGRLNRWRRTKSITGQKGYLEYYAYKSRIEFGIGQAITRKGTQGIRVWLCYNFQFKDILKKSILNYISLKC